MKNFILTSLTLVLTLSLALGQASVWKVLGKVADDNQLSFVEDKNKLLEIVNMGLPSVEGYFFKEVFFVALEAEGAYQLVFTGDACRLSFYARRVGAMLEVLSNTACMTFSCSEETGGCLVMYDQGDIGRCSPCGNGGGCAKISIGKSIF